MRKRDIFIVALLQVELVTCFFDPLSLGLGSVATFIAYKMFSSSDSSKSNERPAIIYDRCEHNECCQNRWIPADTQRIQRDLVSSVHGQQIAIATVVNAIRGHAKTESKALTMSFHGLPGSGKNFIANIIANAYFKKGTSSGYYHFFNGRSYAPRESMLEHYQEVIRDTITKSLLDCERSMFVFDEVDMMPVGLLNVLVPFIDYTRSTGVTYEGRHVHVTTNRAIFIFLSNTGSRDILEQMLKFWESGKDRNDMKLGDFENLIEKGAFNEKGGFHKSDTIRASLIDHYVPFMPLEEKHVRLCMRDAFRNRANPTKSMEDEVFATVTWGPEPHNIYANSGCKKIEQKVISVAYQSAHG